MNDSITDSVSCSGLAGDPRTDVRPRKGRPRTVTRSPGDCEICGEHGAIRLFEMLLCHDCYGDNDTELGRNDA